MKAEIIAVGTELLTPDFQDTNSLFLTAGLERARDRASRSRPIVGDDESDLARVLRTALGRARPRPVHGRARPDRGRPDPGDPGQGPQPDSSSSDAAIRDRIRERFRRRGAPMTASNLKQCYVIEGAEVLDNPNGTAPGCGSRPKAPPDRPSPGPPREIKPMFDELVLPRLAGLGRGLSVRRVIRLTGLANRPWRTGSSPSTGRSPDGVTVTTLAGPGDLAIHLTCPGRAEPGRGRRPARRPRSGHRPRARALDLFPDGEGLEDGRRRASARAGRRRSPAPNPAPARPHRPPADRACPAARTISSKPPSSTATGPRCGAWACRRP